MFPGLPGFYYSPALAWPVCVRTLNNGDCQKQPLSKCVSHTYTKYTNKRSRQFGCWESKYPPPPLLLYNYLSHFYYLHWKYWKSGSICWTRLIIAGVKRRFRTSLACKKVSIQVELLILDDLGQFIRQREEGGTGIEILRCNHTTLDCHGTTFVFSLWGFLQLLAI